jgi:hypothetical protein
VYDKVCLAVEEFGALYVHLEMTLPVCVAGQVERLVGWLIVGLGKVHLVDKAGTAQGRHDISFQTAKALFVQVMAACLPTNTACMVSIMATSRWSKFNRTAENGLCQVLLKSYENGLCQLKNPIS